MERAALYLRLSKEDVYKDDDGYSRSIDNQRRLLMDYCELKNFKVFDVYVDDDYSGLYLERPAFSKLLVDAGNKCFSVVVAKSQSRLSRNMEHADYILNDLFPGLGIRFVGVTDGVDSSVRANKKARQINALVNEWYCEDLSESIRSVYYRKMKDGEYLGAYAPFGYCKSPDDKHLLVVDPVASRWVKDIYKWYLCGTSVNEIAGKLHNLHVPTPLEYRNGIEFSDCVWSVSSIKKILSNETYTGKVIQGKSKRKSFKDKSVIYNPKDRWIVVKDMHEPIIVQEVFDRVQMLRKKR